MRGKVIVVGGGIVGLATALKIQEADLFRHVVVVEKESRAGLHQSTRNSGVLHCGLYYKPGSLKAKLAVRGIETMSQFCREHRVKHEICGKIVLAVSDEDEQRLKGLEERGKANGVKGIRWLKRDEIKEHEPYAVGNAALHVPQEGIVDYRAVVDTMVKQVEKNGGEVVTDCKALRIRNVQDKVELSTRSGQLDADFLVGCAGLHSDRLAQESGTQPSCQIVPFRGEYYNLSKQGERLIKNLVYPVPDPKLPFLGVHFTRMIGGGAEAGPNAVLAWNREGYVGRKISLKDTFDNLTFPGLYRFIAKYPKVTAAEVWNSLSRKKFIANLRRLIPDIGESDLESRGSNGVRAQAMDKSGNLLMDFEIDRRLNQLHLLNAPSPGATASLAIGEHLVELIRSK